MVSQPDGGRRQDLEPQLLRVEVDELWRPQVRHLLPAEGVEERGGGGRVRRLPQVEEPEPALAPGEADPERDSNFPRVLRYFRDCLYVCRQTFVCKSRIYARKEQVKYISVTHFLFRNV